MICNYLHKFDFFPPIVIMKLMSCLRFVLSQKFTFNRVKGVKKMEVSDFLKEITAGFFKRLDESYLDKAGRKLVKRATCFAVVAHFGVTRDSGEPFITHPIAVAELLLDIGRRSAEEVSAGVLHDVVEDAGITISEIKKLFGSRVAFLVDGMTKVPRPMNIEEIKKIYGQEVLSNVKIRIGVKAYKSLSSTDKVDENVIYEAKLYAMAPRDYRLIFVRFADRLHNMRTLKYLSADRQIRMAKGTLEFIFNLARLFLFKDDLELITPWREELVELSHQYLESECQTPKAKRSTPSCLFAI